jgi:multiple sugar transport system permease protein
MAGYFETLPKELDESGADRRRSVMVDVPLRRRSRDRASLSGMILSFIFSWNNFVFGAVLGRETRTLPAAV